MAKTLVDPQVCWDKCGFGHLRQDRHGEPVRSTDSGQLEDPRVYSVECGVVHWRVRIGDYVPENCLRASQHDGSQFELITLLAVDED